MQILDLVGRDLEHDVLGVAFGHIGQEADAVFRFDDIHTLVEPRIEQHLDG